MEVDWIMGDEVVFPGLVRPAPVVRLFDKGLVTHVIVELIACDTEVSPYALCGEVTVAIDEKGVAAFTGISIEPATRGVYPSSGISSSARHAFVFTPCYLASGCFARVNSALCLSNPFRLSTVFTNQGFELPSSQSPMGVFCFPFFWFALMHFDLL